MALYLDQHGNRATPQSDPIPGSAQVANSAGGFSWRVDKWDRLARFLILGSEGGSYYAGERALTTENVSCVRECLAEDHERTVAQIVAVSTTGRAPKNDPAIYALAMASCGPNARVALEQLGTVCRTSTHLFHYAQYVKGMRGWGRSLTRALSAWYERPVDDLAYQAVKYRQRDGWTHRDLLRIAHPKATTVERRALFGWICGRPSEDAPPICQALDQLAADPDPKRAIWCIENFDLPREAIPSELLTRPDVWEALLERMPMTAMLRNLANMTRIGLVSPMSQAAATVAERLADPERLRAARIHPIAVLAGLATYASGASARGSNTWTPVPQVTDALDAAFYAAFGNVEASGKRTMIALDVSGSMEWGTIAGIPGITPRVGSAAMALVTLATEPKTSVAAFSHELVWANISPRQRLDDVVRTVSQIPMGGTDCALPMQTATKFGIDVDTFIVYTDSETWAGRTEHPAQALRTYREKSGIPAKLIVVGMLSNGFTIADPNDTGMMDVVGFDTAAPQVMSDFSAGT